MWQEMDSDYTPHKNDSAPRIEAGFSKVGSPQGYA